MSYRPFGPIFFVMLIAGLLLVIPVSAEGSVADHKSLAMPEVGRITAEVAPKPEGTVSPALITPLTIRLAPVGSKQNAQTNDSTIVEMGGESPEISVFPTTVNESHDPGGQVTTATFTIQNGGDADLTWTLTEDGTGVVCDASAPIGWLSEEPTQATSAPGGFYNVILIFDSAGLSDGTYTGTVCIASNDLDEPIIPVTVTLEVTNGVPPTYKTFMPLVRRDEG